VASSSIPPLSSSGSNPTGVFLVTIALVVLGHGELTGCLIGAGWLFDPSREGGDAGKLTDL
jgi:hypothetical protein